MTSVKNLAFPSPAPGSSLAAPKEPTTLTGAGNWVTLVTGKKRTDGGGVMERDLRSQIKALEQSLPPLAPEQAELLARAAQELELSGIMERVMKAGDTAPDFTLPNAVGLPVSLGAALGAGPAVVTFYRGVW
jgi:hypothetical protein